VADAESIHADRNLTMQLRVTEAASRRTGSSPNVPIRASRRAPFYTQAVTDAGGAAEIKIEVDESAMPDSSLPSASQLRRADGHTEVCAAQGGVGVGCGCAFENRCILTAL